MFEKRTLRSGGLRAKLKILHYAGTDQGRLEASFIAIKRCNSLQSLVLSPGGGGGR